MKISTHARETPNMIVSDISSMGSVKHGAKPRKNTIKDLDLSLIVCTRDRAEQLKTCLEYVARQQVSCAWELIVVDNGSSDETGAILAEYAATVSFPTTVLFEGAPGKSRGLNQAWRVASSDIIAFVDDDCYVAPDYLDRVREAFSDSKIGFGGGRINLFDLMDFPMTIRTDDQPELVEPKSFIRAGAFQGANMMFRRQVLEALGGFDTDFGAGAPFSGDDVEAQARASFAGWWGLYTPDAIVAHHHRRKADAAAALSRRYAIGRGAYMAKFSLRRETRPIYLRYWYWNFRKALSGRYGFNEFLQEMQGGIGYLARHLLKRIVSTADSAGH